MVRPGDRVSHTRPPLQLSLFTFFFLFVLTSLQPFDTLFSQVSFFFFFKSIKTDNYIFAGILMMICSFYYLFDQTMSL